MSVGCSESATTTAAIAAMIRKPADRRMFRDQPHHAVMKARTASAAATSVAPANQSSRRRGSSGAYSHGESTASSANVP